MKINTCTDQGECALLLDTLCIRDVFRPKHPKTACDGLLRIDETSWLVGTNDNGEYTIHMLEDCTQAEAWDFLNEIRKGHGGFVNPRAVFLGQTAETAARN